MTPIRFPHYSFVVLSLLTLAIIFISSGNAQADIEPRIANAYTAWDDYFFYAAFQVNDHNVLSTNRTPTSQPQEDDDVEVFFNTQPGDSATVRTGSTYQMAVSAGSGAYFSIGDGAKIPKAKLVLTYKYAVTIDGSLNDPNDNDTGFTVELAIPWEELGRNGPPAPGEVWGFNVISRNRDSVDTLSTSFASLSDLVHSNDDVQNPSKWTKIEFITTLANQKSGPTHVFCPHIGADSNYPVIDGVVRDGEWNPDYSFSFGQQMFRAAAPTKDQEPNITNSPFANSIQPVVRTPEDAMQPSTATEDNTKDYNITLPGGGEVHVGKLETPPPPQAFIPESPVERGHHHLQYQPGSNTNPLAPNLPPDINAENPIGPSIDPNASLALTQQTSLTPLVLATYYFTYPQVIAPNDYLDQPMDGFGPAFGGNRTQWHKSQLVDARRSGVDVLLVSFDPDDPSAVAGLATLVEGMKEMAAAGQDFPLLGLKVNSKDPVHALRTFLTVVPDQFRAQVILPDDALNQPAYIIYADDLTDIDAFKKVAAEFSSKTTIMVTTDEGNDYLQIAKVGPGGRDATDHIVGREQTHTYAAAWQKVYSSNPNWVLINSWNDYLRGTEVAASRQYAEQYADLTRIGGLQWSGAEQWDAKYLQNNVPSIIAPKTIYTVSIRVENNGSLPWRAGENYSLCYRWYKDGRLYDDSAPRIPLANDIYPGESTTVNVGVVAQNSYGTDIEPGLYTLVFDMVQGQDRWFTYVGSEPLRVPVRVVDVADEASAKAVVLASTTPAILGLGGAYQVSLYVRNEGQETWNSSNATVAVSENSTGSVGTFVDPVNPGAIGRCTLSLQLPPGSTPGELTTLTWTVKTPGAVVSWVEHPYVVAEDLGSSFSINDIDRAVKTGAVGSAKVGVSNTGPYSWKKGAWKVGYRWYYLDGVPATDDEGTAPITGDVAPGADIEVDFSCKAPPYPGRYQLVLFVIGPEGTTTLSESPTRQKAVLPLLVSVISDKNALAAPVALTKLYDTNGIGYETSPELGDFDGNGNSLPGSFMPPDGTQEVDVNPLLAGKPGLPQYPSGFYSSSVGVGFASNHRISFVYGPKDGNNIVTCKGQLIQLPDGAWKSIHILAASVGDSNEETGEFGVAYKDGITVSTLEVANWRKIADPTKASVGLRLPYVITRGDIGQTGPAFLGDYVINLDETRMVQKISLPNDPLIKILAMTVER